MQPRATRPFAGRLVVTTGTRPRALLLGLTCFLAACTTWVPNGTPVPLRDSTRLVGPVRLTDSAGVRHTAPEGALVVGPSVLFAHQEFHPNRAQHWNSRLDSVPARSVTLVEKRVADPGSTLGVVLLVGLGAVVAVGIALAATMGSMSFTGGGL